MKFYSFLSLTRLNINKCINNNNRDDIKKRDTNITNFKYTTKEMVVNFLSYNKRLNRFFGSI